MKLAGVFSGRTKAWLGFTLCGTVVLSVNTGISPAFAHRWHINDGNANSLGKASQDIDAAAAKPESKPASTAAATPAKPESKPASTAAATPAKPESNPASTAAATLAKPESRPASTAAATPAKPESKAPTTTTAAPPTVTTSAANPTTTKAPADWYRIQMRLSGSMCIACLKELEDNIRKLPGVEKVRIQKPQANFFQPVSPDVTNWADAIVILDANRLPTDYLRSAIRQDGYHSYKIVSKQLGREPDEKDMKF